MLSLLDRVPFPLTDERTFFARNDPQGYLDRQETGTADIEGVTGGMTVAVDDDANDGGARVGYVEDPNYDVGTWLVQGGESYQVRSIQKFFTHRPVSTIDRVPFQMTDELYLCGTTLRARRRTTARSTCRRGGRTSSARRSTDRRGTDDLDPSLSRDERRDAREWYARTRTHAYSYSAASRYNSKMVDLRLMKWSHTRTTDVRPPTPRAPPPPPSTPPPPKPVRPRETTTAPFNTRTGARGKSSRRPSPSRRSSAT